jgi:pyrroloquinoline quinone biosynthesis protein D
MSGAGDVGGAGDTGSAGDALRPRIGAGFRLQWEAAQDAHVLLYPEGMVKLNASAGAILSHCDGQRSLAEIVAALEEAFGANGLADDVKAFVAMAVDNRWLEIDE